MAKKVYIMADSSKFNKYDLLTIIHLEEITGVITDAGIPESFQEILDKYGVRLIIAED